MRLALVSMMTMTIMKPLCFCIDTVYFASIIDVVKIGSFLFPLNKTSSVSFTAELIKSMHWRTKLTFFVLMLNHVASAKKFLIQTEDIKALLTDKINTKQGLGTIGADYTNSKIKTQCKDKTLGRKRSREALGCGGSIDLHCKGGCLSIQQVSYTCSEQLTDKGDQKKLVMAKCEDQEKCFIAASRLLFGFKECPKTADHKMYLWVSYRCNSGGTDETIVNKQAGFSKCDPSEAEKENSKKTKSSADEKGRGKTETKKCKKGKKGRKCREEKENKRKEKKKGSGNKGCKFMLK